MTFEELDGALEDVRRVYAQGSREDALNACASIFEEYLESDLEWRERERVLMGLSIWAEVFEELPLLVRVRQVWWDDIGHITPHFVERASTLWAIGDVMSSVGRFEDAKKAYHQVLELDATMGALHRGQADEVRELIRRCRGRAG